MKRDFCKLLAAAMAATTLVSGCNSAQLELDSEDEVAVEESDFADSENESDEESANESEESSEEKSDDDDSKEDSSTEASNEYFYADVQDEYVYAVDEFLYEDITEVSVKVELLESYEGGNVYSLNIDYDDCPGRYYYQTTDRFYLGTIYVTADRIYMIKDNESVPSKEDFEDSGIEICSALDSEIDKNGEVVSIENDGDVCTCSMYNSQTESGFYESFEWTKGKGLTHYRSGYGAEGDPIELDLNDTDAESASEDEVESADQTEAVAKEFFEDLIGTYSYDNGSQDGKEGVIEIKNIDDRLVIADYLGGNTSNYRYMFNTSECVKVEDNMAYVEYAHSAREDGTADYWYYVFEKTETGINVYFSKDSFEDVELLYNAYAD